VIAIANQKGGVGKTTTAVTLAHGMALRGYRVLLVDLDTQGNVADSLGLEREPGLYRLLVEKLPVAEVISPSRRPGLELILGDKTTVEAKQFLVGQNFREFALQRVLSDLDYDFILLDCPPSVDIIQIAAFVATDLFLVPTKLDQLALVGVRDVLNTVAALRDTLPGACRATLLGILPTFWDRVTKETHIQLTNLVKQFGKLVYPPIPQDTRCRVAPAHGQTLWEFAPSTRALKGVVLNGGKGEAAGGYEQVLERLLQEVGHG